jgi:sarcosine oxidase subunit beta
MSRFSFASLLINAATGNKKWRPQWPDAEPKAEYDVVIVGAGGHGLGAAYYLAKEHGITNVAVVEKGWLGGGNTGRNTTIIRSNYLYDESAMLYEHAMKLWEGLS